MSFLGVSKPGILTLQMFKNRGLILQSAEGARGKHTVVEQGPVDFPHRHHSNPLVLFCHYNSTAVSTSGPRGTDWRVDKSKTWEFSHQLQWKTDWGGVFLCIYLQWLIFQGVRAASCHWAICSGLQVFNNFPAGEAFVPTSSLFWSFPLSLDKYLMTWCSVLPRPAPQRPLCNFCCPKPKNVMHQ